MIKLYPVRGWYGWRIAAVWCWWLCGLTGAVAAQTCTHLDDLKFYEQGYRVRQVRIENLLGALLPVPPVRTSLKAQLPLQPGAPFSIEKREQGRVLIEEELKAAERHLDLRFRTQIVLAQITNCQETAPQQLDVVYRLFTSNYNAYFTSVWELRRDEIERPATTAAVNQASHLLTVRPYLGYNRTRQLYGGAQVQMRAPGRIFDKLQLGGAGSPAGNEVSVELVGARAPERAALNRLEYRLGYRRSDWPAAENRLREGTLQLQFAGATRPLGAQGVVLRFGATLEGGNQQTDLNEAAAAEQSVADSGYGALKTYLGATLRTKHLTFAASYGLQLGTRGATTELDFIKHIGDVAFTGSWLPKQQKPGEVHRPTTLEVQLTGGAIKTRGKLPVAERFFGGNAAENFIAGDSWRIRSQPLIRSIPQHRLHAGSTIGAIGGTSFYTVNLTVAQPVWGYPIIPKEIATDPDFLPAIEGVKASTRSILTGYYLSKLQIFAAIVNNAATLSTDLTALITLLDALPDEPEQLPVEFKEEFADLKPITRDRAVTINRMLENRSDLPPKLLTLLRDSDPVACAADPEDGCALLTTLRLNMKRLAELLPQANLNEAGQTINRIKDSLARKQQELLREYEALDTSEAERRAAADMKMVTPPLDAFINELNWIAVSPVGVFDVARLWPDRAGTRFGIGAGVRVTVVNFNLTVGYAVNPRPQLGEGRGALFFAMDVTNLFR